jgi:hypothetical protein
MRIYDLIGAALNFDLRESKQCYYTAVGRNFLLVHKYTRDRHLCVPSEKQSGELTVIKSMSVHFPHGAFHVVAPSH